jgi:diguanylate cyclase (GGDEF)-like protein/PAS domain S-box-containing protein
VNGHALEGVHHRGPDDMQTKSERETRIARNLAALYAAMVGLWIFFSSGIPAGLVLGIDVGTNAWLQSLAGWFFVIASAWLLYLIVNRHLVTVRESEEALKLRDRAIESSVNAIIITDSTVPDDPIVYVNPAFERITGYTVPETLGRNTRFLYGQDKGQPALENIRAALRERREGHAVLRNYRKDGTLFWNDLYIAPVRDAGGAVTHYVGVLNDVSDNLRYQQELEHQANHDTLTDLPNRNLLRDRIQQAMIFAERYRHRVAVAFLDLDDFKLINDGLGHSSGDRLLQMAAERLTGYLRASDTVARIGGDEFVLVLQYPDGEPAVAQHLQRILTRLAQPFQIEGREVYVTCSIGVSLYPQDGKDSEELLRNADAAMYRAKEQGKNNFQFFTAELNARVNERLELSTELRRALERDELMLYYQPQVDLTSGAVVGTEALLRWHHPVRGMVPPGKFVPVAEETGLINAIGEWVLRTACAQNRAWRDAGFPPITVAVNLSARQFRQAELAETLEGIIQGYSVEPSSVELELTESVIMHNPDEAAAALRRLKGMGMRLAIDDFGTGYSSLSYLKRFPIDKLKIDASFVRDIPDSSDSAAIARGVISLGHSLGLRVIAEGVETREQAEFLQKHQCDEAQGYYFGRPMPAEEFSGWLREGRSFPMGAKSPAPARAE